MADIKRSVTLAELLQSLYGVKSIHRVNPLIAAVGVAQLKVLSINPNRLSFTLCNLSANNMYIAPHTGVSAALGIFLAPNGGTITLQWDKDFELVSQEWYIISAGAASNVYVLENLVNV